MDDHDNTYDNLQAIALTFFTSVTK